jgi:hypothetical protein
MYNGKIMRLAWFDMFRICFCAGTCLGGLGGIFLGLMERTAIGIFGGMFFGLLFGLGSGFVGAVYAAVFNVLAPVIGGVSVCISFTPIKETGVELPEVNGESIAGSNPSLSNPSTPETH